jgi:hypothetical protein
MIDHWSFISGHTLEAYQERPEAEPFSEAFWTLNETEHGSDAPDRLHGFDLIRKHVARTPDIDRDLLVPYFLRYLWQVPYPNYIREAWRLLKMLAADTEDLGDAAHAIVSSHPQGSLRAEVLAWRYDYDVPAYLQSAAFEPLLFNLARTDPAPDVRAGALTVLTLKFWDYVFRESVAGQRVVALLRGVLKDDPAASVRALAFEMLADPSTTSPDGEAAEQELIVALQRPDNATVLSGLMASYGRHRLSGLRVNPERVAVAVNAVALNRAHPLFADMLQPFGWFILGTGDLSGALNRFWLTEAPFADGDALMAYVGNTASDPLADVEERALALVALEKFGRPAPRQAFVDFLLDPAQSHVGLNICTKAYASMRGMFTGPVAQAATPHELLVALIAHSRSRPIVDGADGGRFRQELCDFAVRQALLIHELREALQLAQQREGQMLLDAVFDAVRTDACDLSFGLYELRVKETALDLANVIKVVQSAKHPSVGRYTAAQLAMRYANLREDDVLSLIEQALAQTNDRVLIVSIVDESPSQADLAEQPAQLARLSAAIAAAHGRVPEAATEHERWISSKTADWLAAGS